jgi:hypothetical protein
MSQALQLSFQTNTDQARNAIAQLAATVSTNMLTIGTAMKQAYDHQSQLANGLGNIATVARTAVAGFVAFEAITFALRATAQAAEEARQKLVEIVKIGEQAKSAGVGTNFLQQWAAQAKELNTEVEKLTAMLNRAREASSVQLGTGGNPNQSSIQARLGQHVDAGNISQQDVTAFNQAGTQEDRIRVILNLVDKLRAAGKELAALDIGNAMFGKDFADKLRDGVNITQRMRDAMKEVKDVAFPPDVVARAQELNAQLDAADKKMRQGWLPIQQDILRWQQDELASLATIKNLIGDIAILIGGWYTAIKNAGNAITDFMNKLPGVKAFADFTKDLPDWTKPPGYAPITATDRQQLTAQQQLAAALNDPTAIRTAQDQSRIRAGQLPTPFLPDPSKPLPGPSPRAKAESTDEVDTYLKNLQKSVEVLEAENRTFGQSNTVKAEAVDLERALAAARQRGTPLTDAEREAVKKLADEEGAAKDKAEQLQKAQAAANEQAQFLGNQLISAFDSIGESGKKATDVIKDMVKALIKAVEQALLLGSGPFASLFGTAGTGGNTGGLAGFAVRGLTGAFGGGGGMSLAAGDLGTAGPGFADAAAAYAQSEGGWAGSGPRMIVPAAAFRNAPKFMQGGGIPSILHPGEIVLNAAQQKNVAGSMTGGAKINLTHAPVINGTGLSKEEVFSVIQRSQKEFARHIGPIFSDWQRRYG